MLAVPNPLIVATVTSDEVQVASVVTSIVLPSSNVPTALNCFGVPVGPLAGFGVTAIETMVAVLTVSVDALLTTPVNNAVIDAWPGPTPLALPVATVATDGGVEAQVT